MQARLQSGRLLRRQMGQLPLELILLPTTSSTTVQSEIGCCTIDFKSCSPTVAGWCSENEEQCTGACDKWWLPNGVIHGCKARWEGCTNDSECCNPGVCVDGVVSTSSSHVSRMLNHIQHMNMSSIEQCNEDTTTIVHQRQVTHPPLLHRAL
jgi:hypothetical protein